MSIIEKVNIRPEVTILSVLKHLNYKPWYALAEFVDNAIDSFLRNESKLKRNDGIDFKLQISIEIDVNNNSIRIQDNAAGIYSHEYQRAFRAAELPPDTSMLSEYGMGMKSAACWFSNEWKVITKALGEEVERTIHFDITTIIDGKIEELDIQEKISKSDQHYTVIELYNTLKLPIKKTFGKVKEHLKSIYREFIRKGLLDLRLNGDLLIYEEPKLLTAPYFKKVDGEILIWRKELDFDFGEDLKAKGFAALLETASTSKAGFALLRRNRVIEGSADEGFRPEYIFGSSNSYTYQRLIGEIHLDGFGVSHTKDGFQWDDNMEVFLELLREELDKDGLSLLKQAEGYRKRQKPNDYIKIADEILEKTTISLEEKIPDVIKSIRQNETVDNKVEELTTISQSSYRKFELQLEDVKWIIYLELSYNPAIEDFIEVGDHLIPSNKDFDSVRKIGIRLSLIHPFMVQFAGTNKTVIEPILRIIAALGGYIGERIPPVSVKGYHRFR